MVMINKVSKIKTRSKSRYLFIIGVLATCYFFANQIYSVQESLESSQTISLTRAQHNQKNKNESEVQEEENFLSSKQTKE